MRRSHVLGLLVPIALVGCTQSDWETFEFPDGSCRIDMPGVPDRNVSVGSEVESYGVSMGESMYGISVAPLPPEYHGDGLNDFLENVSRLGQLETRFGRTQSIRYRGVRGLIVLNEGTVGRMLFVPEQNRMYSLAAGGVSVEEADRFFESFEIEGVTDTTIGAPSPTSEGVTVKSDRPPLDGPQI